MVLRLLAASLFLIAFRALPARAGLLFDAQGILLQETLQASASGSRSNTFYGAGLFVGVDKKESFMLGAFMGMGTLADQAKAGSTSFSHQDMVLAAKYFFDRQQIYSVTAGYSFLSTATVQEPSATTEKWRGTGVYSQFTIAPEFGGVNLGVSILYYGGSFNEKIVGSTTTASSHTRTFVVPTASLSFRW